MPNAVPQSFWKFPPAVEVYVDARTWKVARNSLSEPDDCAVLYLILNHEVIARNAILK